VISVEHPAPGIDRIQTIPNRTEAMIKSTAEYKDQIIVIWNGDIMAPTMDYILDQERDNQLRFLVGRVKPEDVIQIIVFGEGAIFDRTIIHGKDYLEFHANYAKS